ncbi:MAG: hypothetical protein MSC30_20445, partial [Gaiellaceae bacterium MAG52_C11]|nr:hypothetical protein [Candidatus Gaiellasilicea maunaloa]
MFYASADLSRTFVQGHGSQLLIDAIDRIVSAADDDGGGRVVVVEAIDEAAATFYEPRLHTPELAEAFAGCVGLYMPPISFG